VEELPSTGALSDLEKVTKQAYAMVSIYGLNERVGNISYYDSQGRDMFTKPYSDETAKVIDEEVSKLIEFQYKRALNILSENEDKLSLLAERLLSNEVIFKEDLEEIFGKRQWDSAIQDELVAEEAPDEQDSTEMSISNETLVGDSDFESTEKQEDEGESSDSSEEKL
jgi:cell division protease FtsH